MSQNLLSIYQQCVHHIDSINPHDISTLHFNHDGARKWLCSCTIPQPLNFAFTDTPITSAPLILHVISQISNARSVNKVRGWNGHIKRVTFWVEKCPNRASRALWGQIPRSLGLISGASESFLSFSHLFEVDEDTGVMRLRIVWVPELSRMVPNFISTSYFTYDSCFHRRFPLLLKVIQQICQLFAMKKLSKCSSTSFTEFRCMGTPIWRLLCWRWPPFNY